MHTTVDSQSRDQMQQGDRDSRGADGSSREEKSAPWSWDRRPERKIDMIGSRPKPAGGTSGSSEQGEEADKIP